MNPFFPSGTKVKARLLTTDSPTRKPSLRRVYFPLYKLNLMRSRSREQRHYNLFPNQTGLPRTNCFKDGSMVSSIVQSSRRSLAELCCIPSLIYNRRNISGQPIVDREKNYRQEIF